MVFMRVQSSELVANLFQECDPAKGDYHGLCKYVLRLLHNLRGTWAHLSPIALARFGRTSSSLLSLL